MAADAEESRWLRWRERIDDIRAQITYLVIDDDVFRRSMAALRDSGRPGRGNVVYEWILYTYGRDAGIGLRRMMDTSKGARSLRNLLSDIQANTRTLSLKRFEREYEKSFPEDRKESARGAARREFARLLRVERPHITKAIVRTDIERLDRAWEQTHLKDLVNTRIAHYYPGRRQAGAPSWRHVHGMVRLMERLWIRYNHLLRQDDRRRGLLPGNWSEHDADFDEFWRPQPKQ